jgi:Tfp pilus assembly protein PilF
LEAESDLLTVARERFSARDYRGAALLIASAIEAGQGYADAHHMLGLCYAMTDWRDEALASFDAAIRLNPRYVEAHLNRSIVLSDLGRPKEAEEALSRARGFRRSSRIGWRTCTPSSAARTGKPAP